jgi:hypothetical protein
VAGHMHQPLLDAIREFAEGYGKDERYRSVLEGLQGAVSGLKDMGPGGKDGDATPGQLAARLAGGEEPAKPAPPAEGEPADAPKNFADATAAAKERMAAAR